MGFIGGVGEKMAAAGAAESAHSLIPNEVNRIIGQIGWILQNGREIDLRQQPEPNLPANAQNAVKKYEYHYHNFQQTHVRVDLYLVYISMSAMDCVYFVYVNGANAATFRMQEFVQIPPGGAPMLINRERLDQEVRGFLQGFGSLNQPQPGEGQVIVRQPQPVMVVTSPPPQQVVIAQSPQPMMMSQGPSPIVTCPRCGTQFQVNQTVTQTGYQQTSYGQQQFGPSPQMVPQGQPQNVFVQNPGPGFQQTNMGPTCPRCGQGHLDTMTNRCMSCGWQF